MTKSKEKRNLFVAARPTSDTALNIAETMFNETRWHTESGIENALRALLKPHCTFQDIIIYRSDRSNFMKLTRTLAGWTQTMPLTDTRQMHIACRLMSNCISREDILTVLGNDTVHA